MAVKTGPVARLAESSIQGAESVSNFWAVSIQVIVGGWQVLTPRKLLILRRKAVQSEVSAFCDSDNI
jgi:hypothetical protein